MHCFISETVNGLSVVGCSFSISLHNNKRWQRERNISIKKHFLINF
jgi:hypothetical protein